MAAPVVWDEQQAYEELLYWDRLLQEGHRLLPHDFDRYTRGVHSLGTMVKPATVIESSWMAHKDQVCVHMKAQLGTNPQDDPCSCAIIFKNAHSYTDHTVSGAVLEISVLLKDTPTFRGQRPGIKPMSSSLPTDMAEHYMLHFCIHALILFIMVF